MPARDPAPPKSPTRALPRIKTLHILVLSGTIHLALLLYARHVDTHPERYGGLRYTDVDWRVVIDGARHIFGGVGGGVGDKHGYGYGLEGGAGAAGRGVGARTGVRDGGAEFDEGARGWLGIWSRSHGYLVGDPYNRATFRYTPLLPLYLSPSLVNDLLGKVLLSLTSLAVPLVLLARRSSTIIGTAYPHQSASERDRLFWPVHLLWTLNPFVLNITTRGSPEAVVVLIVIACFACMRSSEPGQRVDIHENSYTFGEKTNPAKANDQVYYAKSTELKEGWGALLFALAISFKIYPIIYTPALWMSLAERHGLFGWRVWRFGILTAISLILINGTLWLIWGQPFLEHTFLYHLSRLDHRHNFSPYFYPIYLSLFPSSSSSSSSSPSSLNSAPHPWLSKLLDIVRHPLTSFIPQNTLVLALGFLFNPLIGLERTAFLQTAVFVVFNKVCTSQYFVWFIPLIPALLAGPNSPRRSFQAEMRMDKKAWALVAAWIAGQAMWLGSAYKLELLARDAYLQVWAAGIGLTGIGVYILGAILDAVTFTNASKGKTA